VGRVAAAVNASAKPLAVLLVAYHQDGTVAMTSGALSTQQSTAIAAPATIDNVHCAITFAGSSSR